MLRWTSLALAAFLGVTACEPPPPYMETGVGFDPIDRGRLGPAFEAESAARDAALEGREATVKPPETLAEPRQTKPRVPQLTTAEPARPETQQRTVRTASASPSPAPSATSQPAPQPAPRPSVTEIAAAALAEDEPSAEAPEAVAEAESGAIVPNNPGISDENDFAAVSQRETIESDAERIRRNAELYEVIQPGELPPRTDDNRINVVAYALRTDNPVGVQLYKRPKRYNQRRFLRNCARYATQDAAQAAFLERGGPVRDPLGLDPDGDGFACYWDPTPFRKAVGR